MPPHSLLSFFEFVPSILSFFITRSLLPLIYLHPSRISFVFFFLAILTPSFCPCASLDFSFFLPYSVFLMTHGGGNGLSALLCWQPRLLERISWRYKLLTRSVETGSVGTSTTLGFSSDETYSCTHYSYVVARKRVGVRFIRRRKLKR